MQKVPLYIRKGIEIVKALKGSDIPSPRYLIDLICEITDVDKEELLAQCREDRVFRPRQAIQYLLRENFGLAYKAIGRLTNKRHDTVISAIRGLEDMLEIYGDQVQPLHIPEGLLRKYSGKDGETLPYLVQTPLEISAPFSKTHVYYIALDRPTPTLKREKISNTISVAETGKHT